MRKKCRPFHNRFLRQITNREHYLRPELHIYVYVTWLTLFVNKQVRQGVNYLIHTRKEHAHAHAYYMKKNVKMNRILALTRSPNPNRPRRPVVTVNETRLSHVPFVYVPFVYGLNT